jgi:hypothetical protein
MNNIIPRQGSGLHVVVDYETNAILCIARTAATASYVSLGIQNTYSTDIPLDLKDIKQKIDDKFNIHKDQLCLSYDKDENGKTKFLELLSDNLKTENLKNKCDLAKLRAKHIYYQESYYRVFLARIVIAPSENRLLSSLQYELINSDPNTSTYSPGLLEYAEILEQEPEFAYKDLKLLLDSASLVHMKYFAWYRRNVEEINKLHTEQEMTEYSRSVWEKLREASII